MRDDDLTQNYDKSVTDIKKLKEIIKYYVELGISIKNSYALNDFYNSRKPENIIMSLGVDATHSFFKQNKYLDPFKEIVVKNIKKKRPNLRLILCAATTSAVLW